MGIKVTELTPLTVRFIRGITVSSAASCMKDWIVKHWKDWRRATGIGTI